MVSMFATTKNYHTFYGILLLQREGQKLAVQQLAQGLVYTTRDEFENGGFTLKTNQMFFVHTKTKNRRFQIPPV